MTSKNSLFFNITTIKGLFAAFNAKILQVFIKIKVLLFL